MESSASDSFFAAAVAVAAALAAAEATLAASSAMDCAAADEDDDGGDVAEVVWWFGDGDASPVVEDAAADEAGMRRILRSSMNTMFCCSPVIGEEGESLRILKFKQESLGKFDFIYHSMIRGLVRRHSNRRLLRSVVVMVVAVVVPLVAVAALSGPDVAAGGLAELYSLRHDALVSAAVFVKVVQRAVGLRSTPIVACTI